MGRLTLGALLLAMPAWAGDLMQQTQLTGDWGGSRPALDARGIQLGADEILDVLGNPQGGQKQGATAEGRLEVFATIDLSQVWGWGGTLVHANAYQIHGEGLSGHDIGNLVAASNIEAPPATRLFSLWIQKSFADDAVSLRLGQIAADDEFFVSQYAPLFLNATFGWPSILGINLPSGGPSYPLARPGARIRAALSPRLVVSAAVFSGDPRSDETGFNLHMNGDVFVIGEVAYSIMPFGLPGTLKLGAWHHSGLFADQQFDRNGAPLTPTGTSLQHRGNDGGYFIIDQLLWRTGASDTGLAGFFRVGGDPPQRNLIALHVDSGLTYTGAFGRDTDVIGLGVSYEGIGSATAQAARAFYDQTRQFLPAPDYESVIELSYQTQLAPWWVVQPDAQWIIHPGGKLLEDGAPPPRDALVLGLRTAINF